MKIALMASLVVLLCATDAQAVKFSERWPSSTFDEGVNAIQKLNVEFKLQDVGTTSDVAKELMKNWSKSYKGEIFHVYATAEEQKDIPRSYLRLMHKLPEDIVTFKIISNIGKHGQQYAEFSVLRFGNEHDARLVALNAQPKRWNSIGRFVVALMSDNPDMLDVILFEDILAAYQGK